MPGVSLVMDAFPRFHEPATSGLRTAALVLVFFALLLAGIPLAAQTKTRTGADRRVRQDTARVMEIVRNAWSVRREDTALFRTLADSAVLLARRGMDSRVLGEALLARAAVDTDRKRYQDGMPFLEECVRVCEVRPDSLPLLRGLVFTGQISFQLAETDRAIRSFRRAYPLAMAIRDTATAALAQQWLGHMGQWKGDVTLSIESYERALRLYEAIGDRRGLSWVLMNIGDMQMRKGDFESSLRYQQQALGVAEEIGDSTRVAMALGGVALVYDALHRYDDALRYFERCIALRERLPNRGTLAHTLELAGAICTNKGDYARAETYVRRSAAVADAIGDTKVGGLARWGISRNFREQGQSDSAIIYARRALALYRRGGHRRDVETMYRKLNTLYQNAGRIDEARACLDSSLQLAKELNERGRIAAVHFELAELAEREGDYRRAYEQYRLYTAAHDSVINQHSIEQINELTVRYETDKKDQQITLLEKDKRIADLELLRRGEELERQRLYTLQRDQELEMLAQQKEIQELTLAQQRDELSLSQSQIALGRAENTRKQQALDLQSSRLSRETLLRNAAVVVLLLVILLAVFIVRGLREKRKAAALRASSAESEARASAAQAEAAEARAVATQAEGVRRAKEIQEAYSRQLIASQEQERKRIAGALHDGIGQDLLIIKHRAMMALEEGSGNTEHLKDILDVSAEAIDDVRRMSRDLRPYQLERVGLTATLRSMIRAVDESTDLEITDDIADIDGLIAPEREIDLYRVLQEALNNVLRHAHARRVQVRIGRMNGSILLSVRDDGRGFDADAARDAAGSGLGLQGMAERVRMLGGNLAIESAEGQGTSIRASLPVDVHAEAAGALHDEHPGTEEA